MTQTPPDPVLTIDIEADDSAEADWRAAEIDFTVLASDLRSALIADLTGGVPAGTVCVRLTDDAQIRALNSTYRGKDTPTNVLAFPAQPLPGLPGPAPLGDIALAFETVAREAGEQGKSFRHHVTHLMCHGVLHLLGYDHDSDSQAAVMEALESRVLARLGIPNPYEDTGGGQ